MAQRLYLDLETYSAIDLKSCGAFRYVDDDSFLLLLLAYAFDDEAVQIIDLEAGETLPQRVIDALNNPNITKLAFNAQFERTCLNKVIGYRPPDQWECVMIRALTLGLPASLNEVGKVLSLDGDLKKLSTGSSLINLFCKPNRQGQRNLSMFNPEKWESFKDYCIRDVETERAIYKLLEAYPVTIDKEKELWELDQIINENGVRIHKELINNILTFNTTHTEHLLEKAKDLTGLKNPKSVKQLKEWLAEKKVEVESLNKDSVKELISNTDDLEVVEMLELRQQLSKSSIAKYEAMQRALCRDGTVKGTLQFYGANRSGRWGGRIIQPQNLPSNRMKGLNEARQIIIENDFELLSLLYSNLSSVFSQLIRTAIIPSPGKVLVVADFAAIEARILAWLAEEKWVMDVFASHGKIYEATAAQMFNIPIEQITKDSDYRKKGKVANLACGYQGSVGALRNIGGTESMSDEELQGIVDIWRKTNPNIVNFWNSAEAGAKKAINLPGSIQKLNRGITMQMIKDTWFINLPSGRALAYKNAHVVEKGWKSEIKYDGTDPETHKWAHATTYGGKIVENITQAIARDCLAETLVKLHKEGYSIKFHVHDEVIIEVDKEKAEEAKADVKRIMAENLDWASGLILKAEAFITDYYLKD